MRFKTINEAFGKYAINEEEVPEVVEIEAEVEPAEEVPDIKAEMPEIEGPEACDAFITETAQEFAEGTITADEVVAKVEEHIDELANHEGTTADEALNCVKDVFNRAKEFTAGKVENEGIAGAIAGGAAGAAIGHPFVGASIGSMAQDTLNNVTENNNKEDEVDEGLSGAVAGGIAGLAVGHPIIGAKVGSAIQDVSKLAKDVKKDQDKEVEESIDAGDLASAAKFVLKNSDRILDGFKSLGIAVDDLDKNLVNILQRHKGLRKQAETNEELNEAEESYGEKAWILGQIIMSMNNEEAYFDSGFLYVWPDGETKEECMNDFSDPEYYEDLENCFKAVYSDEEYHNDGLYDASEEVVNAAHEWDKKLGLEPIEVL